MTNSFYYNVILKVGANNWTAIRKQILINVNEVS